MSENHPAMRRLRLGWPVLAAILIAAQALSGCLTITRSPGHGHSPAGTRARIKPDRLDTLKERNASREEILLALGEPDRWTEDRLEYSWVMSREKMLSGGYWPVLLEVKRQGNTVTLRLDAQGRMTGWELTQGPWTPDP